jgi:hypothetical protein
VKAEFKPTKMLFDYEITQNKINKKRIKQIKEFYDCFDASQANDFSCPIIYSSEDES